MHMVADSSDTERDAGGDVPRFASFTLLELEVLRPGVSSRRPELAPIRAGLVDEVDAEYERRANLDERTIA